MKPHEFFEKMARYKTTGTVTLSPGPFEIKIGDSDIEAARLLEIIAPSWDDMTEGEFEDHLLNSMLMRLNEMADDDGTVLVDALWKDRTLQTYLSAWWWTVFFAAMPQAYRIEDIKPQEKRS